MNAYRTFEVNDVSAKLKGVIQVKDNEKENSIMAKLRKIGFKINKKKNKVVWWHEDYVEHHFHDSPGGLKCKAN